MLIHYQKLRLTASVVRYTAGVRRVVIARGRAPRADGAAPLSASTAHSYAFSPLLRGFPPREPGAFCVPARRRQAVKTRGLRGRRVAFSNEQHRRRYAENAKHREQKLAANRAYRAQHRERLNALWRDKWRSDAAYREQHARARLGKIYGLSAEQHRQLLDEQDGVCAICRQSSRRALCVDHCHATQRVRGLLCDKCNTALGLLDEDVGRMLAAVAYLDRARGSAAARCAAQAPGQAALR